MQNHDSTWVNPPLESDASWPVDVPALTVLFHPDPGRVGERAILTRLLAGQEVQLSRLDPLFSPPEGGHRRPPDDRYLSRDPIRLLPAPGERVTIEVGTSPIKVRLDEEEITAHHVLEPDDLARGVVLELSGRLVLLLHRFTPQLLEPGGGFGLIGASTAIEGVRSDIHRVADLQVPVLLRGPTGSGKELVAHAIHQAGPRQDKPFVSLNLGAISPSLAASELFGSVKGAFTGAVRSREGYFRRANGGTLFLDEIGEAPPEVQVMLLRVLETGELSPVGSDTPRPVDVRLVSATDADLEQRVRSETFRAPLLHRLGGYEIHLPPLAARRDDVGRLLVHFLHQELDEIGEGYWLTARPDGAPWISPRLVSRLACFHWPGNVRQLRNIARQLVIGSRGRSRLVASPQIEQLLAEEPTTTDPLAVGTTSGSLEIPPRESAVRHRRPSEVSDDELLEALRQQRWDLQAAARELRVSRPSIYDMIARCPRLRTIDEIPDEEIQHCREECGGDLGAMATRLEVSRAALRKRLRSLDRPA